MNPYEYIAILAERARGYAEELMKDFNPNTLGKLEATIDAMGIAKTQITNSMVAAKTPMCR